MKIRFLELENFKSYAGLHRVGPFEDSVSCIIGPNGCGKSNVLDSLLFIFGFRSDKLRQDNLKSLIHKSSASMATSCRVSVILETKEGQIKITRAISESGYSYYYLNDSKCTLDLLKGLLFEHGIDLRTNHFMILQGEIERLAELSPKELLAHMEYLFGSEPFIGEIETLQMKYDEVQIELHTIQSTLKVKRKALEEVQEGRDRALLWTKQHIRVLQCEEQMLNLDVKHFSHKADNLARQLTVVKNDMQAEAQKQVSYNNDLRRLDEELPLKERQLKNYIVGYKKLEEEYNEIKLKIVSLKTSLEFKEKDFTMVYNKKGDYKDELQRLRNIDGEKEVPLLKAELKKVEEELESRFSNDAIKRFSGISRKRDELTSKKEEFEANAKELDALKATLAEASKQLQQLKMLREQKEQSTSELKADLNILMNRVLKSNENIVSYEDTLAQLRIKTAEMSSARNVDSIANLLTKQLKKASESGLLQGLHGKLREYCWIDSKYEKAFHTVCPQLDYYIADTYENALAATKHIKSMKLGRATFIVLEQLTAYPELERAMKTKFTPPVGSQRIFDLVQGDSYRNVLYWSITDTLVVNNLQDALPIAYGAKRYRVVTLNGDFIDISGTMTSAPPNRNSGTEDLQSLKNREKLIEKLLADEKVKQKKDEQELHNKKQLLEAVMTKRALLSDDPTLKIHGPEEVKFIEQKVAALENSQKKLTVSIEKLEPQLAKLSDETCSKDMHEYSELKSVMDIIKKKLKTVASSEGTCEKLQARIDAQQAKETALQAEINRITAEQQGLQARKKQIDVLLEEQMSQITRAQLELSQLKEERRSLLQMLKNADSNSHTEKLLKLTQAMDKARAECERTKDYLRENKHQMNQYRNSDIIEIAKMAQAASQGECSRQPLLTMTQANRCVVMRRDLDASSQGISNDYKELKIHLSMLRQKLQAIESKGPIDLNSIGQFNKASSELNSEEERLASMKKQEETLSSRSQKLKEQRLNTFLKGFAIVSESVKSIYHELTKGDVDLTLVDVLDPFSEGVELTVRPPNKTWKKVNLLSGGEKTMTALALTFAFSRIRHCPFYLMDEIDAALDYRNTGILAKFIRNRQTSQMVVISLRRNMYEEAESLTGVYKINNCSRTLTVKASELEHIRICASQDKLQADE